MAPPLSVDPTALAAIGGTVAGDGDAIAAAIGSLGSTLSGAGAMFGHDAAGIAFSRSYTASGKALLDAAASAVNACRRMGFGVQTSAANYGHANASSTVGGGTSPVPVPSAPAQFSAPGMPPPLGSGVAAPVGWALVEAFVGDFWPDGNPGQLHAAAAAWRSFGTAMTGLASQIGATGPGLGAQQIPEAGQMVSAVAQIGTGVADIGAQAQAVAAAVDGFANSVEATQNAVRGLLQQLSPSGLLDSIGGIFSGHNPIDEIRQVAHEIKAVLDNMKRQADATGQLFSQGINLLDSATNSLEAWANKEFTSALGREVGGALSSDFNAFVDLPEGGLKFVAETAQSLQQLDPTRFAYDPEGAAKTWGGMLETTAGLLNPPTLAAEIASDPQGSLDIVKSLVDWKDVEDGHPFRAVGYNGAQVATALIPGVGEAEPAIVAGGAEGRVAATSAQAEERAAVGATREGVPLAGTTSVTDGVSSQATRIGNDLNNIKVPESTAPAAAPGPSAPLERAPIDAGPSVGHGPVDSPPPAEVPRPLEPSAPVAPHDAQPAPAHADVSAPHASEAPQIPHNDVSRPPVGGAPYESAPISESAPPPSGGHGIDSPAGAGAEDRVPASVGAHSTESAEGGAGGASQGGGNPGRPSDFDHQVDERGSDGGGGNGSGPDDPRTPADHGHRADPSGGHGSEHSAGHDEGDDHRPPSRGDHSIDSSLDDPPPDQLAEGAGDTPPGGPEFNLADPLSHMSPELRAMSEQHLTGSGETVLGPFRPPGGGPSYIDVADQNGASYFSLGDEWDKFSPIEQLAANQHVLDVAIANQDTIKLSVDFEMVKEGTFTAAELRYLEAHGYRRLGDNTLVPPP